MFLLAAPPGCCVSDRGPKYKRDQAIISGVVGGVLFFIVAIILSVCAVKICNKRKRRKAEKAYMMVTCPVADSRNGGHSHGGSPVSLKKHPEGRVPGVVATGAAGGLGPWWPVPPEPPPAAPAMPPRRPAMAATTPRASSPGGLQLLLQGFPDDLSPVSGGDRSLPSTVPSSAAFSTPPSRELPCGFRPIHAPPAPMPRASGSGSRQPPLATSSPPYFSYGGGYTRERLLGAVQRVRCTALRHHSAPELQLSAAGGSAAAAVALRPDSASLTSGSSGRGSSAGAARGDSLQGELRPAAVNFVSSSLVPPRDQSVDENYEFDPALSPALGDDDDAWRGLSDSELYSTAWDAETRCAALKREFLRRRRRPLESAC